MTWAAEDDALVRKRKPLRQRQLRIILNKYGCDCLYFPKDLEPTAGNFLAPRTSPLADSHVGEELGVTGKTNITQTLVERGTDPLKLVLTWCHAHGLECFWSFRMNETHDGPHGPNKEYPLSPTLKAEHPGYMIGQYRKRPRHRSWTSVNYALAEICELAFRYIEEVFQNYRMTRLGHGSPGDSDGRKIASDDCPSRRNGCSKGTVHLKTNDSLPGQGEIAKQINQLG
jgi:hypothetical protein